jgi:uncharacterized protein
MDVTPQIPAGSQVVEGYGDGGFTISGRRWEGSVLVLPNRTQAWAAQTATGLTLADLADIVAAEPRPEILILGMGVGMEMVARDLRIALRGAGIIIEPMGTGAACRTYNVLLTEGRRVAAALIAV